MNCYILHYGVYYAKRALDTLSFIIHLNLGLKPALEVDIAGFVMSKAGICP